jgi:two-component system, cell cycle sensor histidine kinase and response regulator CckA
LSHKKTTILAAVILLALFCAVVLVHDHHARKKAHARIASHADIVANALWNHNQEGAEQYLSLACRSHNYASIVVRDIRGKIFQHSFGEAPTPLDRFFTALNLMPQVTLSSPVRYDDKVIGTIEAEWNCDTIYFDIIFLVVLVMVFAIFQLYRGLVREKKVLEDRVAKRTRELSALNTNLQQAINKHKKSKQALERSEERYRAYFEENIAGAYISSPAGRLITCNQEYLRIFGFEDKRQALETNITDIYASGADREKFLDILGAEKQVAGHETTFRRIDGTLIHLIENAAAVFDENGNLDHIRGFLLDITEKRFLESQLIQTQKMESIGRLAGGVAHDFNNMLNVILGHTDLALDKVDPSDSLHNNLQQIRKAADHSAEITKKLLGFARKQTISPKSLDLNETVEGMFKMLRRLIGEDIDLLWRPAGKLWPVKIDPSQVDQILANLCVNARDAIPDRGRITIETGMKTFDASYCAHHPGFVPGDFVLLAVSDNGCGMNQETQDNMFEPFFTTKGVGKGTGLGLSTVYGIVKQNNGFINVYTEQGTGTTFHIYLPRHGDETAHIPTESSAQMPTGNGETILIVEDEDAILELLQAMLLQLGYAVLAESSPRKALELARAHDGRIHLLVTDVVMPEMNGRELAGQMTALYPDIRLLFMSGYTANVIAHQGVLEKGVQFIQKPFSMQQIAVKVDTALNEK